MTEGILDFRVGWYKVGNIKLKIIGKRKTKKQLKQNTKKTLFKEIKQKQRKLSESENVFKNTNDIKEYHKTERLKNEIKKGYLNRKILNLQCKHNVIFAKKSLLNLII